MKIPRICSRLSDVWLPALLILLFAVATFFCVIGIKDAMTEVNPQVHSITPAEPAVLPAAEGVVDNHTEKPLFIIRSYDGRIAVYKNGDPSPFEVLEVYVFTLPENDRRMLDAGIGVNSTGELQAIIEDYTG